MIKNKNPKSKIRARPDYSSIIATITEAIAIGYGLKHSQSIEWIFVNDEYNENLKVVMVQEQ